MTAKGLCIGLDVGTSGVKAILLAEDGAVVAGATADYPLLTPRPGWTEQEPDAWWRASLAVLRELASKAPGPVEAIGLTGQMHGAVFLDRDSQVIRPAILWNDQRTAAECAEIEWRVGAKRLRGIAGNPALTGFQAPKVLWLRKHEPEAYRRVERLLLPKDFIRLRLTGALATDASDAAGTLLLDLAARDWSDEILGALEIPRGWLPKVLEGPEVAGRV
ncbi:MAG: FGGY family carbohydrate kinase, partial [Geminicoccales bacterium]